ncbi:hypothetical protein HMPREF9072_02439 [Capnocytophaga sp. oral taxon 324 str. F0483]|nr:hypothetical protein HMPREF9072_02439 [Capnocytophaga sp. oral taxon 324 str. F0483]
MGAKVQNVFNNGKDKNEYFLKIIKIFYNFIDLQDILCEILKL